MPPTPAMPAPRRLTLPARALPTGATAAPITLSVHEAGDGPAVVLCHGFPELAYSWRHPIPALAAAGFRAIAPDQRGYGASDRPDAVTAEWDPVLRPQLAAGMQSFVPDLETVMIEKCGHWMQQEKPAELNRVLTDWLGRRFR